MDYTRLKRVVDEARLGYMISPGDVLAMYDYFAQRIKEKNEVIDRVQVAQMDAAIANEADARIAALAAERAALLADPWRNTTIVQVP